MVFSFRTISKTAQGLYKEKGSKFLSFAYPVSDEPSVKNILLDLKKKYFDAQHHCYAYVLDPEAKRYKAFDDGEPNHSAGDPILGQLKSKELTNVLVVVVRYFGGKKLGVGGLVQAYKTAAEEALRQAPVVEVEITKEVIIQFGYEQTTEVMGIIKKFSLQIAHQAFEEPCRIYAHLKIRQEEAFCHHMAQIQHKGIRLVSSNL
ncbi:MAG: YigZ family protein [Bacteroidetes bacterium]|nr:YigZ family protein [Bacteroidota bacterium]MBS1540114.1 YigZ family protein [Bacteroidota bacterium]